MVSCHTYLPSFGNGFVYRPCFQPSTAQLKSKLAVIPPNLNVVFIHYYDVVGDSVRCHGVVCIEYNFVSINFWTDVFY